MWSNPPYLPQNSQNGPIAKRSHGGGIALGKTRNEAPRLLRGRRSFRRKGSDAGIVLASDRTWLRADLLSLPGEERLSDAPRYVHVEATARANSGRDGMGEEASANAALRR